MTTRLGSLDFLRGIDDEHRRLLLSKEEEVAEYKRSQQDSLILDSDDEGSQVVILATDPLLQHDSMQPQETRALSWAELQCLELERQVGDMKKKLEDERAASARTRDLLYKQLSDTGKASEISESTMKN